MSELKIEKSHIIILAIVWAIIHVVLFWHFGIRTLYDSRVYIQSADFLSEYAAFEDAGHVFYSVPITLIALFRSLFGPQVVPFLIFQCILSGFAVLALYRSGEKVFNNSWAGFVSGLIFLIWWDNIHWNTAVMTDSLLCSSTCFVIYLLTHFKGTRREYYYIVAILIVIFFIRPTSIAIILGTIAFFLQYHWSTLAATWVRKLSLLIVLLLISYIGATLMFLHWDFTEQYKAGNIVTYIDTIEGSPAYKESLRLDTAGLRFAPENSTALFKLFYFIIHNPLQFIQSATLKVWYLVSGFRPYYSTFHNIFIAFWMTSIYFLCYHGWRKLGAAKIVTFTATVVVVNCGVIAISTVDWDNRFYLPMEPGIVLLAGGGALLGIEWIRKKKSGRLMEMFMRYVQTIIP